MQKENLKRTLGLFALVAYGVGDTLGAGIYAMVGKIAGIIGPAAWLAFVAAIFAAGLTALSYAELSSRYPYASGEAHFTFEAFRFRMLSHAVGFLVFMSGITSMCAVAHAFAGYLHPVFPNVPVPAVVIPFFLVIGTITILGIEQSSRTNIICTIVEVSGLLIVIVAGLWHFKRADVNYFEFLPELTSGGGRFQAILTGAVMAFYAFIGFEDMVKAGEEVKDPRKNLPRAILLTLVVTGIIYVLVALSAVTVVSPEGLKNSKAPLLEVVRAGAPWVPAGLFTGIALFAVANTALVNFMMTSRILYGMSRDGLVPAVFGKVHPRFQTPHIAAGLVFAIVLTLTLTGNLTLLAQSTAVLLLCAFVVVNLSLLRLKWRREAVPVEEGFFQAPVWAPLAGAMTTTALLFYAAPSALLTAAILVGLSFALFGATVLAKNRKTAK